MPLDKPVPALVACSDCNIRKRAVCAKCDNSELDQLSQMKFYRTYDPGQQIMFEGDDMSFVASVVTGAASLSRTLADGRVQMMGLLLPSDFIGRPGRETVSYDVIAVQKTMLCCFRRKPFETLLQTTPHITERLLEMTLDELEVAREWMVLLGRKTAREKITSLLAMVGQRTAALHLGEMEDGIAFEMPITRESMSNYLGLTIETVSRQMTGLRKEGIIALDGHRTVQIPDVARLMAQTGEDR